jgi:broad specificity phosphatase PhoE
MKSSVLSPESTAQTAVARKAPAALTRLFLIRHAEVEARYQHTFGGSVDMDISARGHEQAAALAGFLQTKPFDALYASPMKRVQQTLAPLLRNGTSPPTIRPNLREVDFGDWTGHGWEAVREKFGVSAFTWLEQLERGTMSNAENAVTFRARVAQCLEEILAAQTGKAIAVFCHGGVIRMALSILLDLPLSRMSMFEIDYASVSELELKPHRVEIQLLNLTPWRDIAP